MRIEPDTRDSLTFLLGFFGLIVQGVLPIFHIEPSSALLATFGGLLVTGVGSAALKGAQRGRDERDDDDDPPSPRRRDHE